MTKTSSQEQTFPSTQEFAVKNLRTLFAVLLAATMAFPSMAASERIRPVNLYLSTGANGDGECSPTELTTSARGSASCGPISPTGGSTTWNSNAADEGFPFVAAGGQEAKVTIVISDGTGLGVPGNYDFVIDVVIKGDKTLTASHSFSFDASQGDMTVEFTIPIENEMYIDGGSVTVSGTGVGIPVGYSVEGQGGSFIRILPPGLEG